jgi:hypothetical protein
VVLISELKSEDARVEDDEGTVLGSEGVGELDIHGLPRGASGRDGGYI